MKIYLIYEGDYSVPMHGCLSLDKAKERVKEYAQTDTKYMLGKPDRYHIISPFVFRWVEEKDKLSYEYTEQRHITMTGEWLHYWGVFHVREFEVEE